MSTDQPGSRTPWARRFFSATLILAAVWLTLSIPESEAEIGLAERAPFIWGQDSTWFELERNYAEARRSDCETLRPAVRRALDSVRSMLEDIAATDRPPTDPLFRRVEQTLFAIAPSVAGCPEVFPEYLTTATRLRDLVKIRSTSWRVDDPATRQTMYRLLYGGRAALEEVMLQLPAADVAALVRGLEEPSSAPSADLMGVTIHSGDILVSRGGAATSALIARGNDFPGNFSHVALVHIDATTREVRIVESHIEKGVAIATVGEYLRDTKLRIMVMRLRHDHPSVKADPMVAHSAAVHAMDDARSRHIPYDFEMRYDDPSKLFCSEVASAAYAAVGIRLWRGLSTISTPGLRAWLGAFGVRYFETQEPSDLEYDPQLSVVAEWRDPETLYQDHLDNAVTEAMLEGAERGEPLAYDRSLLPMARLMKGYSVALNLVGHEGPIPEGMSATAGLRNRWYTERHAAARASVTTKADAFRMANGYRPPYWRLLEMARASLAEFGPRSASPPA
ncbi:MAG: hypothetical protein MUE68_09295 [Bacteroidetes bacterium]|nr:hypothetical protein [Bacteroidota bacterium]